MELAKHCVDLVGDVPGSAGGPTRRPGRLHARGRRLGISWSGSEGGVRDVRREVDDFRNLIPDSETVRMQNVGGLFKKGASLQYISVLHYIHTHSTVLYSNVL